MLEIPILHAALEGREILKGIDLSIRARRSPRDHGPERLGKSTLSNVLAGRGYEASAGEVLFDSQDLLALAAGRAHARAVPRLPVPGRDPGRQQPVLPEGRSTPSASTAAGASTRPNSSNARRRGRAREDGRGLLKRPSTKASRAARRSATKSCRWRCSAEVLPCSTRPTRPRHRRAEGRRRWRQRAAQPRTRASW